jgi:hypothetical protein
MAWTTTKAGGFTKNVAVLSASGSDTLCLAGAGAIVHASADDVTVSTASSAGGLNDSYVYETLDVTFTDGVLTVPEGAHMLKVYDNGGGGLTATVYMTGSAVGQDTTTISGIGADPS